MSCFYKFNSPKRYKLFILVVILLGVFIFFFQTKAQAQICGSTSYTYNNWDCDPTGKVGPYGATYNCLALGPTTIPISCYRLGGPGNPCGWQAYVNDSCYLINNDTACVLGSLAPAGGYCGVVPVPSPSPSPIASPVPTPPPGCSCNAYSNGACGAAGGCPVGQRQQTRTCSPAGCDITSRCVSDGSCVVIVPTPTPAPLPTPTPTPPPAPTLTAALTAIPATGTAPLNGVDLRASVGGTATGNIRYEFGCTAASPFVLGNASTPQNPYTELNECNYASAGTYTPRVRVTRQGVIAIASTSVVVSGPPLPPPPTVDLRANASNGPITIAFNTAANLTWSSTNATGCTASASVATPVWSGGKATSGSQSSGNLTSSRTFTLSCTGAGGNASDSVTVNVSGAQTFSVTLSANPPGGAAPLNGVSLTADVSGTAVGIINYQFDCNIFDANATPERTIATNTDPYSTGPLCNYTSTGTYTAGVTVIRGGLTTNDTVQIVVTSSIVSTLGVTLTANPSTGNAPLTNVDLISDVTGTAVGSIRYQIDCTDDGIYERDVTNSLDPYTAIDLCSYTTAGIYNPRVRVTRQGVSASDTAVVTVTGVGGGQCRTPNPQNPGTPACVDCPTCLREIIWTWPRIPQANQYEIDILNGSGATVLDNSWQNEAVFSCVPGTCEYRSSHPLGSYRARVRSRNSTGSCTISGDGFSSFATVGLCTGDIQARAVIVDSVQNTCPFVNDPNASPLPGTVFGFSTPGGIPSQTQTGGNYVTWNTLGVGDYTLNTVAPLGFNPSRTCWISTPGPQGEGNTATLRRNASLTYNVGFSTLNEWLQVIGGSIRVRDGSININLPTNEVLVEKDSMNQNSAIVSYGPSYTFNVGNGTVSQDGYLVKDGAQAIPAGFNYYNYYFNKFDSKINLASGQNNPCGGNSCTGVYIYDSGNLTVYGNWKVRNNQSVVIFVANDLIINTDVTVDDGGFLAFIVRENVSVSDTVGYDPPIANPPLLTPNKFTDPNLSGIIIAGGVPTSTFSTEPTLAGADRQFIGAGTFVANQFSLKRDLESNNTSPGEFFIYRPDLWVNAPKELKEIDVTWEEVKP